MKHKVYARAGNTCEGKLNQGGFGILSRVGSLLAGGFILHLQSLETGVQPLQHVSLAGQPTKNSELMSIVHTA